MRNLLTYSLFALLLILQSACVAPNLTEAQSVFNASVEEANRERLIQSGLDLAQVYGDVSPSRSVASPAQGFNEVIKLVEEALKKPDKLRQKKLLASAYVLRGLAHLQLQHYQQAAQDGQQAVNLFQADPDMVQDGGRDLALAHALGALVENAKLYHSLEDWRLGPTDELPSPERARVLYHDMDAALTGSSLQMAPRRIVAQLETAQDKVTNSDDTRLYLQNQLMASLLNWKRVLDTQQTMARQGGIFQADEGAFRLWEERKSEVVAELGRQLARLLDLTGADHPSYLTWVELITG